jgi:hypothetical protein
MAAHNIEVEYANGFSTQHPADVVCAKALQRPALPSGTGRPRSIKQINLATLTVTVATTTGVPQGWGHS